MDQDKIDCAYDNDGKPIQLIDTNKVGGEGIYILSREKRICVQKYIKVLIKNDMKKYQ